MSDCLVLNVQRHDLAVLHSCDERSSCFVVVNMPTKRPIGVRKSSDPGGDVAVLIVIV